MSAGRAQEPHHLRRGALTVGAALALWLTVAVVSIRSVGRSLIANTTWAHWDSGHYLTIAEHGYSLHRCVGIANRQPTDWCGRAGWMPGYPYAMRALTWSGMSFPTAGRLIAAAGLVAVFALLWFGFLADRPPARGRAALALAAVFPGAYYFGVIFPVSMTVAAQLGGLALMQRRRWWAAGICASVAVASYPSGVLFVAAAIVPLAMSSLGPLRERLRAAIGVALPGIAMWCLVMANYRRSTGHWNAWFRVQGSYGFETGAPWTVLLRRLHSFDDGSPDGWIAAQTAIVAVLMVVAIVVACSEWQRLGPGERAIVPLVTALWIVPLVLGGDLSIYRAEAFLVPIVVLLARLRPAITVTFVVLAIPVAIAMGRLMYTDVLT